MRRPSQLAARTPGEIARFTGSAALALSLTCLSSCSDRAIDEGPAVADAPAPSFFVDRDYLDGSCVSSGVRYPIATAERTIDAANPAPTDATIVALYRASLADALSTYARRLFDDIGLRKITLCRNLSVDGTACRAFADVEHGTLFVNIDAARPDASLKKALHHEIFHFIDFAEDGRLDDDPSWSRLNPPSFVYGEGGGSMQNDPGSGDPDESLPGFLDRYSTSGLAEDKAEIYSFLMVDEAWVRLRAEADPIIGRKVGRVRAALDRFGPLAPGPFSRAR